MSSNPGTLRPLEFWAVDDVSFELRRGESVGLVGPNGSGKTTALQMINGIFWPDKGKISVKGRVGALIAVGAGFHPMLSGRENIYVNAAILGMTKTEVDKKFDSIVDFADVDDFLDTPVKYYSSGMFVRLGFAIAAHCDPDILLVDEVLAVGDAKFQRKCLNRLLELRKQGVSFILVSHNMQSVEGVASIGIAFNHGKVAYHGDIKEAIATYELMMLNDAVADETVICEDQDPDALKLVKKYSGYGTNDICLETIRLLDADGRAGKLFESKQEVILEAVIRSNINDNVRLLVEFGTDQELRCLGTAHQFNISPGRHLVRLSFKPIQLTTGRYKVYFNIFDDLFTNPYSQGHYGYFEVQKGTAVRNPGINSPLCWAQPDFTVSEIR